MEDKKYYLKRSGKILEDTYKIDNIEDVITCPHCKKLIGITDPEVKVIEESEEIPLYTGDCVDCKFLSMPTEEQAREFNYHLDEDEETKDEDKFIARCEIQGNVNPIFFTKKDLEDRKFFSPRDFSIRIKIPDDPSRYRYQCYAFKKRDKKIDLDKL